MRPPRDTNRPGAEALEKMRAFTAKEPTTRWAAYQNVAMDSPAVGHLKFLPIGPNVTLHAAPVQLPETPPALDLPHHFCGWVNLSTGLIEASTPTEVEGTPSRSNSMDHAPLRPLSELTNSPFVLPGTFSLVSRRTISVAPVPSEPSPAASPPSATTQSQASGNIESEGYATSIYTFRGNTDEEVRVKAAQIGVMEGPSSKLWYRLAREGDVPMASDGIAGTTVGVVLTGPNKGPIAPNAARDLLEALDAHSEFLQIGGTYSAKTGHLLFINVKGFYGGVPDADFVRLVEAARELSPAPIAGWQGTYYAEQLVGPRGYAAALRTDPLALRAARQGLDRVEEHHLEYARDIGADLEVARARIAEMRAALDYAAEELEHSVPQVVGESSVHTRGSESSTDSTLSQSGLERRRGSL